MNLGRQPHRAQPGLLTASLTQRTASPASPEYWLSRGGAARPAAQPSPAGLLRTGYIIQTSLRQAHLLSYCLLFVFLKVSSTRKVISVKSSVSFGKVSHPYLDPGQA